VEIDVEKIEDKYRFNRMFVALRPCVDGFLAGCRPFIGVDASYLHGKYKGQLASATGVDGNNWLYHIAYGFFESETEDNWKWFLQQLHKAIGDVPNLVICTDACKGLETAVGAVFPQAENRECMRHLYQNRGLRIQDYVHEYYSVARFKAAYQNRIEPIPDRSQWPEVDLGFKVYPPLLGRGAGRPKVQRQRGYLEKNSNKKKVRCPRCGGFGHFQKTCKEPEVGENGERAPPRSKAAKRYVSLLCTNYIFVSLDHYTIYKCCLIAM
jgi:hypothetical protein